MFITKKKHLSICEDLQKRVDKAKELEDYIKEAIASRRQSNYRCEAAWVLDSTVMRVIDNAVNDYFDLRESLERERHKVEARDYRITILHEKGVKLAEENNRLREVVTAVSDRVLNLVGLQGKQ
jgi:hypothetical protein